MSSERVNYVRERQGTSAIERIVVIAVGAAVLIFNVWFFFFAGSSIGGG